MSYFALTALALLAVLGCDPAAVDRPGPVTAGPSHAIEIGPGETVPITLEDSTDPRAVVESEGLIVAGEAVMLSARVMPHRGSVGLAVQLGPRGGPWRTVALAADPPIISPLIVYPRPGELARVIAMSAQGALIRPGAEPRQTYLTAVPIVHAAE